MAVVEAQKSEREQFMIGSKLFFGSLIGALAGTVVGPIVLAILIGKIWGH